METEAESRTDGGAERRDPGAPAVTNDEKAAAIQAVKRAVEQIERTWPR